MALNVRKYLTNCKTYSISAVYNMAWLSRLNANYICLKVIYHPLYGMNNYVPIWGD